MTFELLRIKQSNTKKIKEPKIPSAEKAMNNTIKGVILNQTVAPFQKKCRTFANG